MWSNLYMWRRFLALQMESLRLLVDFQFLKIEHGIKVRLKMRKWMKKKQSGKLQLDSLSLCFCYVVMSLWKLDMVKRLEWKWKREWRKNRAANCSLIRSRSVSRSVFVPRVGIEPTRPKTHVPIAIGIESCACLGKGYCAYFCISLSCICGYSFKFLIKTELCIFFMCVSIFLAWEYCRSFIERYNTQSSALEVKLSLKTLFWCCPIRSDKSRQLPI